MQKAQLIRLFILVLILALGGFLWFNDLFGTNLHSGLGILMAVLTGLWLLSLVIKDASIIDIFWGIGFVIMGWFYFGSLNATEVLSLRQKIYLGMITLWGLRLALYLAYRNIGKGEDYRYAKWREDNGKKWWWLSFIRVFVLQGFLIWIISSVFLPALHVSDNLGMWEY